MRYRVPEWNRSQQVNNPTVQALHGANVVLLKGNTYPLARPDCRVISSS